MRPKSLKEAIDQLGSITDEKLKWTDNSVHDSLAILARSALGGTVEMTDADFVQLLGNLGQILRYKHEMSIAIGEVLINGRSLESETK